LGHLVKYGRAGVATGKMHLKVGAVGLKSDGTMGQTTTGHLEVNTPLATVLSLSTCDGHTTGHWPVALFKRRDRRRDTF